MDQTQATQLKADFDRDGYVIIRNFVSAEQVEEIKERGEAARAKLMSTSGQFTNVTKGLERIDSYFDELLHRGEHVPILEMLLGKKPEPTTASFFTKSKNEEEVHPHSDAMKGGVIWVALDEANRDNGALHFIRGSYLREKEFAHLKANEPTDLSDHPDLAEAAMKPGDIVFFRPTTVHWSGPNLNGKERRGFNCFYVGDFSRKYRNLSKAKQQAIKNTKQLAGQH